MDKFNALVLRQTDGQFSRAFEEMDTAALPAADVLIRVAYSSLNYKDGLAVTGKPGVVRQWPMIPGIDLAGTVVDPGTSGFQPGQEVVVTIHHHGKRRSRVKPGEWQEESKGRKSP